MSATTLVDELLAPWEGNDAVPLPDLAAELNERGYAVTPEMRREAVRTGLITPVNKTGRGVPTLVSQDDARRFIAAALLGLTIGIGLILALRIFAGGYAQVGSSGVVIPISPPIP